MQKDLKKDGIQIFIILIYTDSAYAELQLAWKVYIHTGRIFNYF